MNLGKILIYKDLNLEYIWPTYPYLNIKLT